jgi:hypothetical protein
LFDIIHERKFWQSRRLGVFFSNLLNIKLWKNMSFFSMATG